MSENHRDGLEPEVVFINIVYRRMRAPLCPDRSADDNWMEEGIVVLYWRESGRGANLQDNCVILLIEWG